MSKVTAPLEVVDSCPSCEGDIFFGQKAIRYGQELLCCNDCLQKRIGAVVVVAGDLERGDVEQHENDPTD